MPAGNYTYKYGRQNQFSQSKQHVKLVVFGDSLHGSKEESGNGKGPGQEKGGGHQEDSQKDCGEKGCSEEKDGDQKDHRHRENGNQQGARKKGRGEKGAGQEEGNEQFPDRPGPWYRTLPGKEG